MLKLYSTRKLWLRGVKVTAAVSAILLSSTTSSFAEGYTNNLNIKITDNIAVDKKITGTVKDETDTGIPGVSIVLKGTTRGTITNVDGTYEIEVPNTGASLIFSLIGYASQEISVGNQTLVNVSMTPDDKLLEEVVVIGYGTLKKSDLTGSVSSVKEEQLLERPAPSLAQGLSGRMAGVQVSSNSGRPGGKTQIRIRGFSSINSSNNPLYVVDGVMLPQGNQSQFTSAIDYINPNDIVSVEVLKDASSTAIYGARGANGVILVTTKKGKAGDSQITYNTDLSVNVIGPNPPQVLNAEQYMATEDLAWANMEKYDPDGWAAGKWEYLNPALRRTDPRVFDANGNPKYDTNWLEANVQNKISQNHQLGFSGGNQKTQHSLSLGYRNDQGLLINSYLKRYSARFTIDDNITSWLKVGGTLSYNNQTENVVDISDAVARQIVEDFPFLPVRYEDGTFANNRDYPFAEGTMSSVHRSTNRKYIMNTQTSIGSIYSNIKFMEGLEMRTVLGTNIRTGEINQSQTRTLNIGAQGNASAYNGKESFWSLENYLTYTKDFKDIHSITGLLGISWQETNFFDMNASVSGFATDYFTFNNLGAGATNPSVGSGASRNSFNSYFGRLNYGLKNKYLVTFTGRADGSSKFGENHKFAFFPSGALAWRVSEENFLQGNNVISNLKLRTSYGLTGNSEIPAYSSLSLLSSNYSTIYNDSRVSGTGLSRLANPDLRWEKTAQTDFGVEVGLFNGRINLEADYYYRKTTDMLLDAPVPQTSGYATIRRNVGSMENKGLELTLNTNNIVKGPLEWTTSFNISFNQNKVLSLATPSDIFGVGGPNFTNPTNIIRVGEAVGSFWGLTRLGVWSEAERDEAAQFTSYRNGLTMLPGDIKYLDVNGDKAITDADRSIIGNGSPKGWGALTNNLRFKGFDFLFETQFMFGNDVMMMNLHPSEDRQALANSYTSVLDAWTPTNQNTMIAEIRDTRAGYVTNVDSHWIKNGSFLRGKNAMLGYTFPQTTLEKLKLSRLRVYTSVQNFFLLVEDPIVGDPETSPVRGDNGSNAFSQGMIWHNYPKPTTYMLGLQVTL
ncbi:SusC/RagA family TonB-linked outer membrane protein [Arcticibacterium luteifluviistationis]|uniref:SusC/RagA family TonB-linked outer membrane protein n=1 Tax=Arcticibacterium luteifluviistationis TaxID=1784714 RepID=A0A2Z4G9N5_9BACT|nr:TonB-dependent receptor [Arcticibacterium luteifluviistationis]AWV97921.1 SusC/RagA family TonB-linked outer membrane protein [Arcticibacterium luteifluviistationis]